MYDKENMLAISSLNIAGRIEHMSDEQIEKYFQMLESFVDNFPPREEKLRAFLEGKDYDSFSKYLDIIWEMLTKIHADDMAKMCVELIESLKEINHEKIEAATTELLSNISMMSVDIQMLKHSYQKNRQNTADNQNKDGAEQSQNKEFNILAVDDSSVSLEILKTLLSDIKEYKITCLSSGMLAMRYIQHHRIDLYILDIEMPDMDGYELASKIKELGHTAPIIFLTASAVREAVEKAMAVGVSDFIIKPISKPQVHERIKKYLY